MLALVIFYSIGCMLLGGLISHIITHRKMVKLENLLTEKQDIIRKLHFQNNGNRDPWRM